MVGGRPMGVKCKIGDNESTPATSSTWTADILDNMTILLGMFTVSIGFYILVRTWT